MRSNTQESEYPKELARKLAYQMSGMDFPHMVAALLEAQATEAERCQMWVYGNYLEDLKFRVAELRRMAQEVLNGK